MAKVKLNLANGTSEEKSIISSFEVLGKKYLILDAESVGSMGLPIILVSGIVDGKAQKLVDPIEWQAAKNNLKSIIAGNSVNYLAVDPEMPADDIYYTQLTLPVASFDLIKSKYVVPEANVINEIETPMEEASPVVNDVPVSPVFDTNAITESAPLSEEAAAVDIAPFAEPSADVTAPALDTPVMDIPVNPEGATGVDYSENKEAFMKACENMFDALVAKFEAEYNQK